MDLRWFRCCQRICNAEILIKATNSEETITGSTDENGEFFITGFPEGIYTITISNPENNTNEIYKDVEVYVGEVTALGTVTLDNE